MSIFAGLNDRQREAVEQLKGPLLVVAGAGSGKTRVLTHRVAHMIERGIAPYNILAVTFTNKAAGEMRHRIENLLGKQPSSPFVGTFHALGVRILRVEMEALGYSKDFSIFDASDTKSLVRQILKDMNIDPKKYNPKGILAHVSGAKNLLLSPEKYIETVDNTYQSVVARVYAEYEKRLRIAGAVDFDDLLVLPVRVFQGFPDILEKYQERWKFLSIDEYQDTNHAQYILSKLLAEKYRNICAIGDSDQSIYSFRGADIQNILDFTNEYSEAKTIKLEQNYRSSQNILNAADGVISQNVSRVKKKMFTEAGAGALITLHEASDEQSEATFVMRQIEILKKQHGYVNNDFVVLYRTNAQSRQFEEAALRYGLPYQIVGGIKFYERAEIKDLIAYLRFVMNSADTVSFERIVNKPSRRIGAASILKIMNFARQREMPVGSVLTHIEMSENLTAPAQRGLERFANTIRSLRAVRPTLSVSDFLLHVIETIEFEQYLRDGTQEGDNRWDNVQEFVSVARKYDDVEHENALPLFLEEIALITDADAVDDEADMITFMTLHAAKGLEFPVVFITGCEENIFPHSRAMFQPDDLEEERRLMYVGITRAMQHLLLSYARQRLLYGNFSNNQPSRFLREIPSDCMNTEALPYEFRGGNMDDGTFSYAEYDDEWSTPQYAPDDVVEHPQFGEGNITTIEGDILTIDFGNGMIKRFAASIAPLKKKVSSGDDDVVYVTDYE